jgi:hypothetical protein
MAEIHRLKMKKAELNKQLQDIDTEAEALVLSLRDKIDPYVENVIELELDEAESLLRKLKQLQVEAKGLQSTLRKVLKDLGE